MNVPRSYLLLNIELFLCEVKLDAWYCFFQLRTSLIVGRLLDQFTILVRYVGEPIWAFPRVVQNEQMDRRLQAVAILGLEKLDLPLFFRYVFKLAKQLISLSLPALSMRST